MKKADRMLVSEMVAEVGKAYPFQGYIEDTVETMETAGMAVLGARPSRGALLDIGCGGLNKTALFSKLGFHVYGADEFEDEWHRISNNFDQLMTFAKEMSITIHRHVDGDYTIPWEKNSFDVVTILNVMEHITESPRHILNTAGEYLKPGGILYVTIPNSVNLRKRIKVFWGRSNLASNESFYSAPGKWRGHVREFTISELSQILQWNGFKVEKSGSFHAWAKRKLSIFPLLQIYKAMCFLVPGYRDSVYAIARKPEDWKPREVTEEDFRVAMQGRLPSGVYDPHGPG